MKSQPIGSRLPAGNPKLLVGVDVVPNLSSGEHLLCYKKYQQSKGEYMVYSARLMAGELFCIKPYLLKQGREKSCLIRIF